MVIKGWGSGRVWARGRARPGLGLGFATGAAETRAARAISRRSSMPPAALDAYRVAGWMHRVAGWVHRVAGWVHRVADWVHGVAGML